MVEESLVTGRLPESARTAGRLFLERVEPQVPVSALFWNHIEEDERWRLYLATPLTESQGPLSVYTSLQSILNGMTQEEKGTLELTDISVVNPHAQIVAALRRQYGVVEHEDSRRVRRADGPYIYRLTN